MPGCLQSSVETIAKGHEASVRIASQGHHAAAVAARLPESTLTQMLKSALSVEVNTEVVSMRLLRCIKADRWRQRGGSMLRSTGKQTGGAPDGRGAGCAAACLDDITLQRDSTQQGSSILRSTGKWAGGAQRCLCCGLPVFTVQTTVQSRPQGYTPVGRLQAALLCLLGRPQHEACCSHHQDTPAVTDCLCWLACSGDPAEGTEGGGASRDRHRPGPHWERAAAAGAGWEALDGCSQELDARPQGGHPAVHAPMCSWKAIAMLLPGTVRSQAPAGLQATTAGLQAVTCPPGCCKVTLPPPMPSFTHLVRLPSAACRAASAAACHGGAMQYIVPHRMVRSHSCCAGLTCLCACRIMQQSMNTS